ncbi:hypothetical protein C7999DRAFT_17365, partial [Corynascus novoguineensis]
KNGPVTVGYVTKTSLWQRIILSQDVEDQFVPAVQEKADAGNLSKDVKSVALILTPHASEADSRTHFTAFEMQEDGDVSTGTVRHILPLRK